MWNTKGTERELLEERPPCTSAMDLRVEMHVNTAEQQGQTLTLGFGDADCECQEHNHPDDAGHVGS